MTPGSDPPDSLVLQHLDALERRIARLESMMSVESPLITGSTIDNEVTPQGKSPRSEEEIEFQVGQNWFARIGIVILAAGFAFFLTLPYEGWPPFLPALLGYGLTAGVFAVSRLARRSFPLLSDYLWGAAMALLYFATLRLFFFSTHPAMDPASIPGMSVLVLVSAVNLVLALRRQSSSLVVLALTSIAVTAIAVGTTGFVLLLIPVLAGVSVLISVRNDMRGVMIYGIGLTFLSHLNWAVGNPLGGNTPVLATEPLLNIYIVLLESAIFAAGTLWRKQSATEGPSVVITSMMNGVGAYGLYLILTLGSFGAYFALSHLIGGLLFLGAAILFWTREQSRYSTFVYAMVGYMGLSIAIIKAFPVPQLFVWLSLQSLVVVATAVWFRSRFIVVANFGIYAAIIIGYLIVASEETGISIGFGIVALSSARILNWQKDRLELKTELMRNAYLLSAFAVFPYALFHLVPSGFVSLAWTGTALLYYLMNALTRSQKYRWMGHMTLMLTALYVVVVGIVQLTPTLRVVSFLALAVVLLAVSMIFTRLRSKKRQLAGEADEPAQTAGQQKS